MNNSYPTLSTAAPVSVVIPCFRCATTIKRAIASIVAQTQKPAEVILVEDNSGDDTLAVLQALAERYLDWIKIIALPVNQGAANARNAGWAEATQPYIAFLDADDAWHPQKIEIQTAYMNAHPEVILCGHQHRFITRSVTPPDWQVQTWEEWNIPKWLWLLSNKFAPTSAMVHRDIRQRFAQNQRYMEDYGLWLDIVYSGNRVTKLSADLAAMYKSPFGMNGLSAQLWSMEQGELKDYQRLYEKNYINLAQYFALSGYSLLKFVRRLVIYWGWLRWKK
ncbi:MAG: glycosyltransferase family 2 protein [Methylococcales bacterium]|nr:glycosyltransferase family 2 protein [Methylococcales bacterium]MDP3840178.1 glycosyltransferase family 2 protein [Methylococcales bacterium]